MNQESRATLEVIAPTVEEAIEKGLKELGVPENLVDIEVLDEGNKGLFGLGNRQARIRLTLLGTQKETAAPTAPTETSPEDFQEEDFDEEDDDFDDDEYDDDDYDDDDIDDTLDYDDKDDDAESYYDTADGEIDMENVRAIARATVSELLEKMNIHRATVEASFLPLDEDNNRPGILVEVLGNDLSILIGKQAETLNALQYVTRLIVGKEIGRGINLVVDVEGYRSRREQNLRQLARRMASQAIKTGRKQMLEPMPANERRIIHIELRDNEEVTTESVGEEPRRKVTIIPVG